jgi:hypothetical protein
MQVPIERGSHMSVNLDKPRCLEDDCGGELTVKITAQTEAVYMVEKLISTPVNGNDRNNSGERVVKVVVGRYPEDESTWNEEYGLECEDCGTIVEGIEVLDWEKGSA